MHPKTNITKNINKIQRKIITGAKRKHKQLVEFGLHAFCLRPFQSAAGNARQTIPNAHQATHKLERLLGNESIGEYLSDVLVDNAPITRNSIIDIDHTDTNYLSSLCGALQTGMGRAIPVLAESTYANDIPSYGSRHSTKRTDRLRKARGEQRKQQSFTEHIIQSLDKLIDRVGFAPRFALDRGFGGLKIIEYLNGKSAIFYIGIKAGRIVNDGENEIRAEDISAKDELVEMNGMVLRLIRSPLKGDCKQPWYILTNDFTRSRSKIVRVYYRRFEIEETFRDLKHIFELRRLRFNKPGSLQVVLRLAMIGISLLYAAHDAVGDITKRAVRVLEASEATETTNNPQRKPCRPNKLPHPKKRISLVREFFEQYVYAHWGYGWRF
jgi:hypothetical protein